MKRQQWTGALAIAVVAAVGNTACVAYAHTGASAEVEAPVTFVEPPTLIAIDGGVWVVQDSDYPVYYVGDDYWVYREGTWYRSRSYDGGWIVVEATVVPTIIVHRSHAMYVHYRGAASAHTRRAPRHEEANRASERTHEDDATARFGDQHKARDEQVESDRQQGVPAKSDAPTGVGNERKSEGVQPGQAGKGAQDAAPRKKAEKKDDKHK